MATGENVSRKSFLKGAAWGALALGVGATSLAGCSSLASGSASFLPKKWDYEADVVVMGFGFAALSSAISAAAEGSSVAVFEKAPEKHAGGNSSVCSGYYNPCNGEGAFDCWRAATDGYVTDDEINGVNDAIGKVPDWFNENVFSVKVTKNEGDKATRTYGGKKYPNATVMTMDYTAGVEGGAMNGNALHNAIRQVVEDRYADKISVYFESEVTNLVFDPTTKEVKGVKISQNGNTVYAKANKGVVMACGGFEGDYQLINDFGRTGFQEFQLGSPYNTGDGNRILGEIGAKTRHFGTLEDDAVACYELSKKYKQAIATSNGGDTTHMVYVSQHGERFMNEDGKWPMHDKRYPFSCFNEDATTLETPNYPWWMVCDATRLAKGPLFSWSAASAKSSWACVRGVYQWSEDNVAEVDSGVVLKATTFEELGKLMGFSDEDNASFVASMEKYNSDAAAGKDTEWGRTNLLEPLSAPPYYAVKCALAYTNTDGGAARDGEYRCIDFDGNPIPRLYAAGEFGSIFHHHYWGGGNVCEALSSGMASGQHVSDLDSWGSETGTLESTGVAAAASSAAPTDDSWPKAATDPSESEPVAKGDLLDDEVMDIKTPEVDSSATPSASSGSSTSDSAGSSASSAQPATKASVESACAGSCHTTAEVDDFTSSQATEDVIKKMVPSLSDDEAASIAAYYQSK